MLLIFVIEISIYLYRHCKIFVFSPLCFSFVTNKRTLGGYHVYLSTDLLAPLSASLSLTKEQTLNTLVELHEIRV